MARLGTGVAVMCRVAASVVSAAARHLTAPRLRLGLNHELRLMPNVDSRDAMRTQARSHDVRLAILAQAVQGKSLLPEDLRRELPTHPSVAVIEYHLLVLRQVKLLPSA